MSSSGAALHLRGESFDISCSEETRHWYVLSNYISAARAEELKRAQKGHCPGDLDLPIKTSSDNAVYLRRHMTLHRYCLPSLHWESKDNISLAESKGKMKNCHFQWVKSPQVPGWASWSIYNLSFLIIVTLDDLVWIITLATINQSCEIVWQKSEIRVHAKLKRFLFFRILCKQHEMVFWICEHLSAVAFPKGQTARRVLADFVAIAQTCKNVTG